jgi:enolase
LSVKGLSTSVGDEGGFAPRFQGTKVHEQALDLIVSAIEKSGYRLGDQISLALDSAASEFSEKSGENSAIYRFEGQKTSSDQMIEIYSEWLKRYPIISIEDGLSEHDWSGWKKLTEKIGSKCQLVGDDLFVTNPDYLKRGIQNQIANAILIKLNQIGTVTETLAAMKMARESKYHQIVSHRSGETEDHFIADLAVGTACGQIKTGSASRTDRIAKYNQLLRIEQESGNSARFLGRSAFTL